MRDTAFIVLNAPFRLTEITASQSCSVILINSLSRVIPALLTNISIFPISAATSSIAFCVSSVLVISTFLDITLLPFFLSSSAFASKSSGKAISNNTISAPSFTNSSAIANPIPRAPPVMIAVLLFNNCSIFININYSGLK